MPKKFKGENTKAVEARLRKNAQRQAEADKKLQAEEDEYWKDDDKHVLKKQQRKDDKEKKRQEQLERKLESEKLLDEEMSAIKSAKPPPPSKLTRAQIEGERELAHAAGTKPAEPLVTDLPLEVNVNQLDIEGDEARTVEDAIGVLSVNEPKVDRHPERRVKAAYAAYEQENLPRLKQENPNMRLSQLKQMLKKDWMKSPENPLNQRN